MDEKELRRVEDALGLSLPSDYRALMLNYPIRVEQGSSSGLLDDDAGTLIESNLSLRRPRQPGARTRHPHAPWPPHYFFIGGDRERALLLDLRRAAPGPVFEAPHDDADRLTEAALSVTALVEHYARELKDRGVDIHAHPPARPEPPAIWGPVLGLLALAAAVMLVGLTVGYLLAS
jgi:hypothetical protein